MGGWVGVWLVGALPSFASVLVRVAVHSPIHLGSLLAEWARGGVGVGVGGGPRLGCGSIFGPD